MTEPQLGQSMRGLSLSYSAPIDIGLDGEKRALEIMERRLHWVCDVCGLVQAGVDPKYCGHPGWPYGPGFAPVGMSGRGRRPTGQILPYDGPVAAGLTDPTFHRLMSERHDA